MNNLASLQFPIDNIASCSCIYIKYKHQLTTYARQYIADSSEAEDLVTEVFIRFLARPRSFENVYFLRSFLYSSVYHACINWHKKQGRKKVQLESLASFLGGEWEDYALNNLQKKETSSELWQAVEEMPFSRKRIFKMAYYEGMENSAIAIQLNLSVNTVKNHKVNALRELRRRLPRAELMH